MNVLKICLGIVVVAVAVSFYLLKDKKQENGNILEEQESERADETPEQKKEREKAEKEAKEQAKKAAEEKKEKHKFFWQVIFFGLIVALAVILLGLLPFAQQVLPRKVFSKNTGITFLWIIALGSWIYSFDPDRKAWIKFVGKWAGRVFWVLTILYVLIPWGKQKIVASVDGLPEKVPHLIEYVSSPNALVVKINYDPRNSIDRNNSIWIPFEFPAVVDASRLDWTRGKLRYNANGSLQWLEINGLVEKYKPSSNNAWSSPKGLGRTPNAIQEEHGSHIQAHLFPDGNEAIVGLMLKQENGHISYIGFQGYWPQGITRGWLAPNVEQMTTRAQILNGQWEIVLTKK